MDWCESFLWVSRVRVWTRVVMEFMFIFVLRGISAIIWLRIMLIARALGLVFSTIVICQCASTLIVDLQLLLRFSSFYESYHTLYTTLIWWVFLGGHVVASYQHVAWFVFFCSLTLSGVREYFERPHLTRSRSSLRTNAAEIQSGIKRVCDTALRKKCENFIFQVRDQGMSCTLNHVAIGYHLAFCRKSLLYTDNACGAGKKYKKHASAAL